jgi:hypothetical protein
MVSFPYPLSTEKRLLEQLLSLAFVTPTNGFDNLGFTKGAAPGSGNLLSFTGNDDEMQGVYDMLAKYKHSESVRHWLSAEMAEGQWKKFETDPKAEIQ